MLKNLILLSFRNIAKDRVYSSLNILGLTIGITCSIFLILFVVDELSFDGFHKNGKDIFRVVSNITEKDNEFTWAVAQTPFAPTVRNEFPEVQAYARFAGSGRRIFKKGDELFYEERILFADSSTFDIFTFEFIAGDPKTCLFEPNSIVLTRDLAMKYFGSTDVIGNMIEDEERTYKITAVIENTPANSHLTFNGLISYNTLEGRQLEGSWGNFGVATYIYTPGLKDPAQFEKKLTLIYDNYCAEIFEQYSINIVYQLQNIRDIYLYSKIQSEAETNGDIAYVYIFSAIAVFMLLIASINYMNLATARSMRRSREVGMRKVMGSHKSQLIAQFITESLVFTLVSFIISLALVSLILPYFNEMLEKTISMEYLLDPLIISSLIAIVVFVGFVGGSYPAFYLSSFQPVEVLKGGNSGKGGNAMVRKVLVVLQFSISIFMIISTWVVYDQLQFLRQKDLGFDKEHVVRISLPTREMIEKVQLLEQEISKSSKVLSVGAASSSPGFGYGKNLLEIEDANGEMVERGIDLYAADWDYINTLGFEIVEGRSFDRNVMSDTSGAVLVTESMLGRMGWDTGIGKRIRFGVGDSDGPENKVIGVIKDYHHNSLYAQIEPMMILFRENNPIIHVRIQGGNTKEGIEDIESAWVNVFENTPFEYSFLDEEFDQQYRNDQQRGKVFTLFSILTIIIASLGLFGLASFTAEQRTQEIGIRKVMGASVSNVVVMMSKEFVILVIISIIIAYPLAWYFMDNWLENFAYKADISLVTFLMAALAALVLSFSTVSFHTIRAAIANPVNALREE